MAALAGAAAGRLLPPRVAQGRAAGPAPRARAAILLWMNGGPSHLDTFDPKPGTQMGGPFRAIATRVPGLTISEHLPQLAEQAQHLLVVRGLSTREGNHDRAQALMHTGYPPNPTVAYPSLGSWVSEELGDPAADLPSFVAISGPSAGAGFLGVQHDPFVVGSPSQPPQNTTYPRGVDFVRFTRRKAALELLESRFAAETGDAKVASRRQVTSKAVRMMYSRHLRAFDLAEEPETVRAAYGATDFGRGCLLARRLVESGVRFVEVVLDGWDTHQDNFGRTRALMKTLDPAMATLVRELSERHLLASTLVLWMGDFGRTPRINEREGRDHYPAAWSVALAGGGLRGGLAHGATDESGEKVVQGQVAVPDLFATMATLLGIDPGKSFRTPLGRPITIADGHPLREWMA